MDWRILHPQGHLRIVRHMRHAGTSAARNRRHSRKQGTPVVIVSFVTQTRAITGDAFIQPIMLEWTTDPFHQPETIIMIIIYPNMPRFTLGSLVATANAFATFSMETLQECLTRHANGDWGDLCNEDKASNEEAVFLGGRLMSSYPLSDKRKLWIITAADRSETNLLLPEDY